MSQHALITSISLSQIIFLKKNCFFFLMETSFSVMYKFTLKDSCWESGMHLVLRKKHICHRNFAAPLNFFSGSGSVQDSRYFCRGADATLMSKPPSAFILRHVTIYRLQQRHAAVFINGRVPHRQSSLLKAEGIRSFIKCKTTDVMADFTPLWKVKQSALWNTASLLGLH